jgi:L-lysine exporter family protein LysE/ArgO|tara:strand:- start:393 stop:1001 length:609 start_codon:yes stop_codon:yes gene_type:complete
MSFLILGFLTGLSLIFALGAQNIFVIEQGLKKEFIFVVCTICFLSDFFLIFLGIFIFQYFQIFFTARVELFLNILLFFFLIYFIWDKINAIENRLKIVINKKKSSLLDVVFKTLSFTYLNPHVYSDTVFFLGNFSKNLLINEKIFFGIGATLSSLIFFFILGYLSKYASNYLSKRKTWKIINALIVLFMTLLALSVLKNILI